MRATPSPIQRTRRRSQTLPEFHALQRLAASAIMRPLDNHQRAQRRWPDGRDAADVIESFIKPNNRLTSLERLEIYNRQYWFRLIDVLHDDFPGLRAVVGARRFDRLIVAYLEEYPSRSSTLRNLGDRLPRFLREHPEYAGPRQRAPQMAREMAAFEWAQVVAFDGAAEPIITVDDLLGRDPAKLTLGVQPYLTAMEMDWPLDEFSLALKRHAMRDDASNAMQGSAGEHVTTGETPVRLPRLPRPGHIFLVVHRLKNSLYYKRLEPASYALLTALRDGRSLLDACQEAIVVGPSAQSGDGAPSVAGQIKDWLQAWSSMGWFCRRANVKSSRKSVK